MNIDAEKMKEKLNSVKLKKPSDKFNTKMEMLFADAKNGKHKKSKSFYCFIGAIAASIVLVLAISLHNIEFTSGIDKNALSNPEFMNNRPVIASVISIDSSDNIFSLSNENKLKDIFRRKVIKVTDIN